ncbi:monocarboxylate transporter 13 isoform 2-T2 [Discoglossus pictus]
MPPSLVPDKDVWGGVLLISCFFQAGLVFGALRSFGVFFPEFVEYFGSAAGTVSWVTSCGVAVQQLMSPLGCALALRYGSRPVVMFGGLLSSLGMFFASFATSLPQLYLSLGGLSGLGWALIFSPTMAAVTQYFSRRRSLATGFVLTGVGVLSFAMMPLVQYLIEVYSWRGALLLLSGISLHSVPCGALLHPLPGQSPAHSRPLLWGWELLCDGAFMRYCLAITLINAGYFVPFAHMVAHMRAKGVGEQLSALLMSLVGVTDVGGRLFAGWLSDLSPRRNLPLLSLWTGLTGVTLGLLPLANKPVEMGVAVVAFGFCAGALTPGVFSAIPGVVGDQRVLPAIGLLQMIESVGGLLGAPVSGWLCDLTGNFTLSFAVSGSFILLGGLIILTLPGICSRKRTKQSENIDHEKSSNNCDNHLGSRTFNDQLQIDSTNLIGTSTDKQPPPEIIIDQQVRMVVNDLVSKNSTCQSESKIDEIMFSNVSTGQSELDTDSGSPSRHSTDQLESR